MRVRFLTQGAVVSCITVMAAVAGNTGAASSTGQKPRGSAEIMRGLLKDCVVLSEPLARLACYDAVADTLGLGVPPPAPRTPSGLSPEQSLSERLVPGSSLTQDEVSDEVSKDASVSSQIPTQQRTAPDTQLAEPSPNWRPAPAVANWPSPPKPEWMKTDGRLNGSGIRLVQVARDAKAIVEISDAKAILPRLVIRCRESDTAAYVDFDHFVGQRLTQVKFSNRFGRFERATWNIASSKKSAGYWDSGEAIAFVQHMLELKELEIEIDLPREPRVSFAFDVSDLRTEVKDVARQCRWDNKL